ncbi:hypothetical protein [Phaeodactylibacter xiamenensis]|uniref:DUF4365 domain-containing protein n=1 Tax=Phaeodactylibacter xiamenensis TaxID=1524460 RepID=A0A098RYG5_9BACT|nr:hypothetical protein [Phaeodactylibacter xiamenensis]KGE84866.1 hypothetical protein IX84_31300 [Phaeodactylibacter xiamenensis]
MSINLKKTYRESRTQEKLSEYHLISKLYEYIWIQGFPEISIIRSEVDKGVDLIIVGQNQPKFIQLKSISAKSWQNTFTISENLYNRENWYVIVVKIEIQGDALNYRYRMVSHNDIVPSELTSVENKIMEYKELKIYKKHDKTFKEICDFLLN